MAASFPPVRRAAPLRAVCSRAAASHVIAPGAGLSAGQYGTLNLLGGLTTNVYTTLLYNLSLSSSIGTGSNGRSIYGGDLINLGGSPLTVSGGNNTGGQIAFTVNPTQAGDYRLIDLAGGSPQPERLQPAQPERHGLRLVDDGRSQLH